VHLCPVCHGPAEDSRRFCSRACYGRGYKLGLVVNSGNFKPGAVSPNKGRTLESWVGEERAREIKARMSMNSRGKAVHLRRLNEDPDVLAKRLKSRQFHDQVVMWLAAELRKSGARVFVLSEYVKEKRIPDAIIFERGKLIALEVETEKQWKPSHTSTEERLSRLNTSAGFFDLTKVVFPSLGDSLQMVGPVFLSKIRFDKD